MKSSVNKSHVNIDKPGMLTLDVFVLGPTVQNRNASNPFALGCELARPRALAHCYM